MNQTNLWDRTESPKQTQKRFKTDLLETLVSNRGGMSDQWEKKD